MGYKVSIPDDDSNEPFMGKVVYFNAKKRIVRVRFDDDESDEGEDIPYLSPSLDWISPPEMPISREQANENKNVPTPKRKVISKRPALEDVVGYRVSIPDDDTNDSFIGTVVSFDKIQRLIRVHFDGDNIDEAEDIPYLSSELEWKSPSTAMTSAANASPLHWSERPISRPQYGEDCIGCHVTINDGEKNEVMTAIVCGYDKNPNKRTLFLQFYEDADYKVKKHAFVTFQF